MREIKINGVVYTIKFSYRAAKYQQCVQQAFELLSGAIMFGGATDVENPKFSDIISGMTKQVSMIPQICDTFFYAGLLEDKEHKPATEEDAGDLLIQYMDENDKSYTDIYHSLMECMEEDGFFKKSGIDEMIATMNQSMEAEMPEEEKTEKVTPIKKAPAEKKTPSKPSTTKE